MREALLLDQQEHENEEDVEAVNLEIERGWAFRDELARRGDETLLQLRSLFSSPSVQVRLNAAVALIDLAPDEANEMLEAIVSWKHSPQSFHAGMTLRIRAMRARGELS